MDISDNKIAAHGMRFILIIIGLLGVLLIALNHWLLIKEFEWLNFIIDGIGVALITTAILGSTVDFFLKKQIIEDVFAAAMGYILPPDLRGEVKALYELEFMCIEHSQIFTFKPTSAPEFILLHKKTERTFKNITSKKQVLYPKTTVLEWFLPNMCSKIIDMGAAKGKEKWTSFSIHKPSLGEPTNELVGKLDNGIELASEESCTVWFETEEIKRATDLHCEYFAWPTKNPRIIIKREEGAGTKGKLGIRVRFGTLRGKDVEGLGEDTCRLVGVLSPGQCIEVRWWMKKDAIRWIQNDETKNNQT